ncbi:MAG: hypothetical protein HOE80_03890 [Candidatus Magasanikbacteria bacterium]|nr:hypothetical protein [Candidatus Magasanikbacteria bacterium]MBT4071837.1 hypothetical protein [Candidatus Magasanikbacteria bacterium]
MKPLHWVAIRFSPFAWVSRACTGWAFEKYNASNKTAFISVQGNSDTPETRMWTDPSIWEKGVLVQFKVWNGAVLGVGCLSDKNRFFVRRDFLRRGRYSLLLGQGHESWRLCLLISEGAHVEFLTISEFVDREKIKETVEDNSFYFLDW